MNSTEIDYSNEYILVVDDDEVFGELTESFLGSLNFKVDHVHSAKEAIEKMKEKAYSFLVTDINMPEIDGIELLKITKSDFPHVCTIAMTGHSDKYKYIDVINAGATDFINKPFIGPEELEAKLRRAIIERNTRLELQRISITDSLTGLYNQRHFYSRLQEEITRAERQKRQLTLILFDLDKFKQYNDAYGHLAGDDVLRKFGKIINAQIRQGVDSGYRYGGDEFAAILIDADSEVGENIGRRIATALLDQCNMSVSVGYANFMNGMTSEAFVDAADKNLYETKENRNSSN